MELGLLCGGMTMSRAFHNCYSLESIFIPCSVATIDGYAFRDCDSLTINYEAASKPVGWDVDWNPNNRPVTWGV